MANRAGINHSVVKESALPAGSSLGTTPPAENSTPTPPPAEGGGEKPK